MSNTVQLKGLFSFDQNWIHPKQKITTKYSQFSSRIILTRYCTTLGQSFVVQTKSIGQFQPERTPKRDRYTHKHQADAGPFIQQLQNKQELCVCLGIRNFTTLRPIDETSGLVLVLLYSL